MSSTVDQASLRPRETTQQALACCLRQKDHVGRQGPVANMGEVVLTNQSADPVEIEYQMSPLQYLELEVTDADGRFVSEGHYSDRFSPKLEPTVLRLLPGEKYVATVALLATLPRDRRTPGTYFVRATYEHGGTQAVSAPVAVEVGGD